MSESFEGLTQVDTQAAKLKKKKKMKLKSQKKVKIRKGTKPYIKRKWNQNCLWKFTIVCENLQKVCENLQKEEFNSSASPALNKLFPSLLESCCFDFGGFELIKRRACMHICHKWEGEDEVEAKRKQIFFCWNIPSLAINKLFHLHPSQVILNLRVGFDFKM